MIKVKYKDTVYFRFKTEKFDNGSWMFVMPDSYEAWLESFETTPEKLLQLTTYYGNDEYFYVPVFFSPNVYPEIQGGKQFYVSFYWTYNGNSFVKRIAVEVIPED